MDAAVFTGSDYRIRVILSEALQYFILVEKRFRKNPVLICFFGNITPPLQFLRWTTTQLRTWLLLLNLQGGRPLTHFPSW